MIMARFLQILFNSKRHRGELLGEVRLGMAEHTEGEQKRMAEIRTMREEGVTVSFTNLRRSSCSYLHTFTVDLSKPPPPRDSSFR